MSKTLRYISKRMSRIFIIVHSHNSWSRKQEVRLFVPQTVYFRGWKVMTARASLQFNTMILVHNQLDAQFFVYVYFYSLHVSDSHVPIIRIFSVSLRHLVYVTLCRRLSGMQEHMLLHTIHVENRNKHTWKLVRRIGYLQGSYQDARSRKHKKTWNCLFNL